MLTDKIKLRKVSKEDFEQIEIICIESFQEDEDVFLVVKSFADSEHFYVAIHPSNQQIVGFVVFGIFSIRTAHLMILAVHPTFQRQGIGTQLLEKAFTTIKKTPITHIRLEVRTTNISAIKFYEKHDFEIVTTIEKYYDDQGDAFLMLKRIIEKKEKE